MGGEIQFIPNEANSGSVFAQWRRAAELASGEFVWLAEADDASEPDFLARALALLSGDPAIQFAFTDSRTIDVDGEPQWPSYKPYYSTVAPGALTETEVFEAKDFVQRFLSVKNLILNVSAVVWRRDALLRALEACEPELKDFRMAGDWRLYLEALSLPEAKVAYEAESLNVHRRHTASVTHALEAERHVQEIGRVLTRLRGGRLACRSPCAEAVSLCGGRFRRSCALEERSRKRWSGVLRKNGKLPVPSRRKAARK